ncbi:MAG: tetratricopeptide repeat protein, partial [Lentisphaerae bacterium]|nr:tetratricopeptide repeat protein [Lentisphaerota bacterium]
GRSALSRKDSRRAKELFTSLIRQYPKSDKLPETRYYQSEALTELGENASAILVLDEIINETPSSYLVDKAWLRKGDNQYTLGVQDTKRYDEAINSFQIILTKASASPDDKLQALYKVGKCEEKLGHTDKALERYMSVVYDYFTNLEKGIKQDHYWFSRAAFDAAKIKELEKNWRQAVRIYEIIINANVPASRAAQDHVNKIRKQYWWCFY